jgi:hypothetical protein
MDISVSEEQVDRPNRFIGKFHKVDVHEAKEGYGIRGLKQSTRYYGDADIMALQSIHPQVIYEGTGDVDRIFGIASAVYSRGTGNINSLVGGTGSIAHFSGHAEHAFGQRGFFHHIGGSVKNLYALHGEILETDMEGYERINVEGQKRYSVYGKGGDQNYMEGWLELKIENQSIIIHGATEEGLVFIVNGERKVIRFD